MSVVCAIVSFLAISVEGRTLIQGNLIWRHGDRSSRHTYPNDPYKSLWKDGIGLMQLTEQGMAQEYDLGLYLKSKYGRLLSEKYREGEIFIRSTDTDRSLMSAQCVAAGLYAAENSTEWKGMGSSWRPFPVHSRENKNDWLLTIYQDPERGCPEFHSLVEKTKLTSKWYESSDEKYAKFFKDVAQHTGVEEPYTIENIGLIYDNLKCLSSNGYKLPDWVNDEVLKKLDFLAGIHQALEFTDYERKYAKRLAKMRSGVILEKIIDNMKKRINAETNFSVIGYSAHDSSVGPLLVSMGSFNWIVPPYASCVMFDLYKNDDGSYYVEFYYRNDSSHEPYALTFYECGEGCSWEKFLEVASTVATDSNTPTLCGIKEDVYSCGYNAGLVVIVAFLFTTVLFTAICCLLRNRRRNRKMRYRKLSAIEEENF